MSLLWENLAEQGPEFPLLTPAICSYNNNTVPSLLFVYSANPLYLGHPPPLLLANAPAFSEPSGNHFSTRPSNRLFESEAPASF